MIEDVRLGAEGEFYLETPPEYLQELRESRSKLYPPGWDDVDNIVIGFFRPQPEPLPIMKAAWQIAAYWGRHGDAYKKKVSALVLRQITLHRRKRWLVCPRRTMIMFNPEFDAILPQNSIDLSYTGHLRSGRRTVFHPSDYIV